METASLDLCSSVFICVHLWFHFFYFSAFSRQKEWNHR